MWYQLLGYNLSIYVIFKKDSNKSDSKIKMVINRIYTKTPEQIIFKKDNNKKYSIIFSKLYFDLIGNIHREC